LFGQSLIHRYEFFPLIVWHPIILPISVPPLPQIYGVKSTFSKCFKQSKSGTKISVSAVTQMHDNDYTGYRTLATLNN